VRLSVPPQLFALATFMFAAFMNGCVKALNHALPLSLIFCSRFLIGLLILYPMIYRMGGLRQTLRTNHPYKQCLRGALSMAGIGFSFYALPLLPLGDATVLWQTQGFFLLLLSGFVAKEKIHPKYFLTCGLGFLGVMLILHPEGKTPLFPALIMLLSAIITAVTTLTVRFVSRKDNELTILTWFFSISSVISLIWYFAFSDHPQLNNTYISLLIGAGIFGSLSQICMTKAFKALGADAIGPYTYSGIIFSTALGFLFFNEMPTLWMLAGATCIILAIHWNHHIARRLKLSTPEI